MQATAQRFPPEVKGGDQMTTETRSALIKAPVLLEFLFLIWILI